MTTRGRTGVATRGASRGGAIGAATRREEDNYERFLTNLINVDANLGLAGWTAERPWDDFENAVFSTDDDFERVHQFWHREFGINGKRVPADAKIKGVMRALFGISSSQAKEGFAGF